MKILTEGKQVGELSYMVENINILETIIEQGRILASLKPERNPITKKLTKYVSLSRNLISASARNSAKWKYGIIIDGDKLSDRYKITPYSFGGAMTDKAGRFKVKYMTLYDNDTAVLNLANWSTTFSISKDLFHTIEKLILDMPQEDKDRYKLAIEVGKRPRNGRTAVKRYKFNTKSGGLILNSNSLGSKFMNLIKTPALNETEERIWLPTSAHIDISKCMKGIIVPKNEADAIMKNDKSYRDLIEAMKTHIGNNYKILTY